MYEVTDDYIVPEQLPGMLETTIEPNDSIRIVGESPLRGIRVGKLLPREIYTSRVEPSRDSREYSRLIIWRPIGYVKRPKGWIPSLIEVNLKRATAYTNLTDDGYVLRWSSTTQRDLRHAQERGLHVEIVSFSTFMQHMPRTGKFRNLYSFMSWQAERFNSVYGEKMQWYVAYTKNGTVAAALGVLYLTEHNFSMSGTSYSIREIHERAAPIALRHRWHTDARARNITYLDWNILWRPGDTHSWKGFGNFKEKFKPTVVYLPPTYITFVPSQKLLKRLERLRHLFRVGIPSSREVQ